MATVISNEDASKCEFKNFPNKIARLAGLSLHDSCVFVIGEVVRVFTANSSMEESQEDGYSFRFVELRDKSGSGFVKLGSERETDSESDKKTKRQTLAFFEERIGKIVYLLNGKVKGIGGGKAKGINGGQKVIELSQWSQLREVVQENIAQQVISSIEAKNVITYTNLLTITPNFKHVNVLAKIVEVIEFKKLNGFESTEGEADSYRVTLQDHSGKIYAVFPKLPKFEGLFVKGAVIQANKASVARFDGKIKGECFIYLTSFLSDKRHTHSKGTISIVEGEVAEQLLDISVVATGLDPETERKDTSNVSNKVWIAQQ